MFPQLCSDYRESISKIFHLDHRINKIEFSNFKVLFSDQNIMFANLLKIWWKLSIGKKDLLQNMMDHWNDGLDSL